MNKIMKPLTLLILLILLLVPANPVYAQGGGGPGKIIFGDNFTLKSGDELAGDLVVFGGNVTIEENADLNGSLVVFGGTISSDGNVNGDVVIFGGQIQLDENAVVDGDVVTIGGQLDKATGADIRGDVVDDVPAPSIDMPNIPTAPDVQLPNVSVRFNPFWEFSRVMGASIFVAVLGMLATLFFQARLDRVSQAVVTQPLMTSSMGLLTIVVMLLLAVTIIFLPFVLLGLFPLALAWLFGVVAIGQEIGDRLAKGMRQEWTPVLTTGIGTFILVFLITFVDAMNNLLPFIACITWVIPILVGFAAIGAVVVTRFGARPVQVATVASYTPPTNPDQLPPAS
jgi:hypothetical protein